MSELDFTTALGRLLLDGRLRDEFAADPARLLQKLNVRAADQAGLRALAPADLEFQARVLLRKRFGLARVFIPMTCARLGEAAGETFASFARAKPPEKTEPARRDALGFGEFLQAQPGIVSARELNRLRFALGGARLAVHWVSHQPLGGKPRGGLQILWRGRGGRWSEVTFYPGW